MEAMEDRETGMGNLKLNKEILSDRLSDQGKRTVALSPQACDPNPQFKSY